VVKDAMPSITKPRCDTEEYATSFFRSGCTSDTSAPYTIPITARAPIHGANCAAAWGKSGIARRRNP
jgi:hypothetical protein